MSSWLQTPSGPRDPRREGVQGVPQRGRNRPAPLPEAGGQGRAGLQTARGALPCHRHPPLTRGPAPALDLLADEAAEQAGQGAQLGKVLHIVDGDVQRPGRQEL